MEDIAISRALHVAAVVVWIGGVTMATVVILPALRKGAFGEDWLAAFHAVESRFIWIARAMALIVGATGFYMVAELDLWSRFSSVHFWWMHAMLVLWVLFMVVLFVAEPLILRRRFHAWAEAEPKEAFARLQRGHVVLVILAFVTILGAVAGAHGWSPF
jgi:uncharacterized membrane protein